MEEHDGPLASTKHVGGEHDSREWAARAKALAWRGRLRDHVQASELPGHGDAGERRIAYNLEAPMVVP